MKIVDFQKQLSGSEFKAGYEYMNLQVGTQDARDGEGMPMWYGWALREAFWNGVLHAKAAGVSKEEGVGAMTERAGLTIKEIEMFKTKYLGPAIEGMMKEGYNVPQILTGVLFLVGSILKISASGGLDESDLAELIKPIKEGYDIFGGGPHETH